MTTEGLGKELKSWEVNLRKNVKNRRVTCVVNDSVIEEIRKSDREFSHNNIRDAVKRITGGQSKFFNDNLLKLVKKARRDGTLRDMIKDFK